MINPDHTLPAAGGSYTRLHDGTLVERNPDEGQAPPPAPAEVNVSVEQQLPPKRGAKSPLKEG